MNKVKVLIITLVALMFSLAMAPYSAQLVDKDRLVSNSIADARRFLGKPRCEKLLAQQFPQYGEDVDWQKTFDNVKIVSVEFIPGMPTASGMTNCDMAHDKMIVSSARMAWNSGPHRGAETIIHEFVHLLSCEALVDKWGSQEGVSTVALSEPSSPEQQEALRWFLEGEAAGYRIGALCVGNNPRVVMYDPVLQDLKGDEIEELK